jgi:excisionase family DNA binding protein
MTLTGRVSLTFGRGSRHIVVKVAIPRFVGVASMPEPIITIARAAKESGLKYHVVLRLIHERRIASVRVAGTRRVRLSAVRACIEEIASASKAGPCTFGDSGSGCVARSSGGAA